MTKYRDVGRIKYTCSDLTYLFIRSLRGGYEKIIYDPKTSRTRGKDHILGMDIFKLCLDTYIIIIVIRRFFEKF